MALVGRPGDLAAQTSSLLGFESVPLTGEDRVMLPRGYSAEVLYAWGDPVSGGPRPRADNTFGHILRWTEDGNDPTATSFRWSIFVQAGDPRSSTSAKRGNIKGDTFGSPDGLWADRRGVLWIQTTSRPARWARATT